MDSILIDKLLVDKDKIDEDYYCIVCENLLIDCLQCANGHIACRKCFLQIMELKKECMSCRCEVKSIKQLSKNRYLEKELGKLKVHCPYSLFSGGSGCVDQSSEDSSIDELNGCKQIITIDQLESHIKQCEYKFIKCTNIYTNDTCSELDICEEEYRLNKSMEHHQQCKYGVVCCELCKMDITRRDIQSHMDNDCPKIQINCQLCSATIFKSELESHKQTDCPNIEIDCIFKHCGCIQKMLRNQLSNHLSSDNHLSQIQNQFEKQSNQINQLQDELEILKLAYTNKLVKEKKAVISTSSPMDNKYFCGKWFIKNWSEKLKLSPKTFISLAFNLSPTKPFSIRLYPRGSNIMWQNLTISLVKEFISEAIIKFSFEVENQDQVKSEQLERVDSFKTLNDSWSLQFNKVYEKSNGFIIDDTLTINFIIKIKKCFESDNTFQTL